ncbi:hypothetical protein [Streptomyces roseirectus]|uniref:hypothetical protein n=1 Tax=Streptomyces roseirectus TaxID=2768066 RepID=UPI001FE92C58|nr:hypothetical protein [Streptomyces roseirectus]
MSYQHPQQQPGWGNPQQPGLPPQPPKKTSLGKIAGIGCGGAVGLLVVLGVLGALVSEGGGGEESGGSVGGGSAASRAGRPAGAVESGGSAAAPGKSRSEGSGQKVVTFKVWGTAPAGALGPLDITYGSDSDNRQGRFRNGEFTATLPFDGDALYYTVTAQLQGAGDIDCSVTVDGHTEKAHASGGYNICHAQANAGVFGGWG